MRTKIILSILKKELIDILRDKKTIFMMIVLPIIMYPVLMIGGAKFMTMAVEDMSKQELKIAVSSESKGKDILDIINKGNIENINKIHIVNTKDYKEEIRENKIDAYIEIKDHDNIPKYNVYINSSNDNNIIINSSIDSILEKYKENIVKNKLTENNMDIDLTLNPISYETIDLAKNEEVAGNIIGKILPMILIVSIVSGSIYPAIDVMAGEKERGTLETLFTLPISNLELVVGKYLAVAISAITAAILNLASIALTGVYIISTLDITNQLGDINFDFTKLIVPGIIAIICILLFTLLITAISMCICSMAKSFKEAQNYVTPLLFAVMIPSYATMVPTIKLTATTALMPVINVTLLFKDILSFKFDTNLMALVLISNIVFLFLALVLLSKLYNSEDLLFGNGRGFKLLEKRSNIKRGSIPSVSDGITVYSFTMILFILVGGIIQLKFGLLGLAITQVMFLGIVFLYGYYIKADFKELLSLRLPKLSHLFGGIVLWMGVYLIVILLSLLMIKIFPQNVENIQELNKFLFSSDNLLITIFIVSIMPAICEEIMFRGFIYKSFEGNKSYKAAIISSGILFGIMHIELIKIIPISVLGIALAYAVYKSKSIVVPMIMHFLNNGLAVLIGSAQSKLANNISGAENTTPSMNIIAVLVLLAISVLLIWVAVKLFNKKDTQTI